MQDIDIIEVREEKHFYTIVTTHAVSLTDTIEIKKDIKMGVEQLN